MIFVVASYKNKQNVALNQQMKTREWNIFPRIKSLHTDIVWSLGFLINFHRDPIGPCPFLRSSPSSCYTLRTFFCTAIVAFCLFWSMDVVSCLPLPPQTPHLRRPQSSCCHCHSFVVHERQQFWHVCVPPRLV